MINRNLNTEPFLLLPAGKDYLWGGMRLKHEYGKNLPLSPLAETWECSTHPDGPSMVGSGAFTNWSLTEVLKAHPEFLGTHPSREGEFPILIKFIDAKQNLSIQVHPDDDYAKQKENGQLGKTELWYVLDASSDAHLIYGFHHPMTKEQIYQSLAKGTLERYLQKVKIKKNDVYFIESGTVHALCAGAMVVEIQENSNLTYRLYDYGRMDKNGKTRQLHIGKAMDVINLKESTNPRQPMRLMKYENGAARELLCRCQYFQVYRYLLNSECARSFVPFQTGANSFQVFVCIDGCGVLFMEDNKSLPFFKGDCIFFPANSTQVKLHGRAEFLLVSG